MGIKDLWTVLGPFCERKPLYELQGKTVAVDLSCWVCEAQNVAEYQVQPRMYLRNLYFRTSYLILIDVNPVFVLEGKAPQLKYDTISARNAIQFKGAKPKTDKTRTGKDRSRFKFVLQKCEEMLKYMGLACLKGAGEAESLCAYLNEEKLVDGCISQDSDCFAYGAQTVYRNFSISTQGAISASGGAVDVYNIDRPYKALNFGRNKVVAMALLVGCDYSDGVFGVGKDSVMKFFENLSDEEVLDRLRGWRSKSVYQDYENQLNDKNLCTSCGHSGKLQQHTKAGCTKCYTSKGCNPLNYKEKRLKLKNELNIRQKAIADLKFPNEDLINEFLVQKDNVTTLDLTWKQPNLPEFIKFTVNTLQWEEIYAFEKVLPILTRWQCRNPHSPHPLKPDRIKKARKPKGVASYEIIWFENEFKQLIPQYQIDDNKIDEEKLWTTIEPQNLVELAYPDLVESFKTSSKVKPKKRSKKVDCLAEQLQNVSISEPVVKKIRKPRQKRVINEDIEQLNTSFGAMKVAHKPVNTLDKFLMQSTPKKSEFSDMFDVDDEKDDLDLSNIVENIISCQQIAKDLKDIAQNYVNTHQVDLADSDPGVDNFSFFIKDPAANDDLFEKAFNETFRHFESETEDCDF